MTPTSPRRKKAQVSRSNGKTLLIVFVFFVFFFTKKTLFIMCMLHLMRQLKKEYYCDILQRFQDEKCQNYMLPVSSNSSMKKYLPIQRSLSCSSFAPSTTITIFPRSGPLRFFSSSQISNPIWREQDLKTLSKSKRMQRGSFSLFQKKGVPGLLPLVETTLDKVFVFRRWQLRKKNVELIYILVFSL